MKLWPKKSDNTRRPTVSDYRRASTYHYSSKRSSESKVFDRNTQSDSSDDRSKKSLPFKLKVESALGTLGISLVLIGLMYLFLLSTTPHVNFVGSNNYSGDKKQLESRIESVLDDRLQNHVKFTFDEAKVNDDLKKNFPEFPDISVKSYGLRHNPVVDIGLSEPVIMLINGTKLFVVDSSGRVVLDASKDKAAVDSTKLILVEDQTSVSLEVGKIALSSDQTLFITEVVSQAAHNNVKVASMAIVQGGAELGVKYAEASYLVKYNLFENARQSSGAYFALSAKFVAEGTSVKEYVDMRVPERAYVK